jgi:Zn finger protein HypA/HybF involved in hydrogenase expression
MLLPERKCVKCGRNFVPDRLSNIYCSRRCFRAHYRIIKKAMDLPIFRCPCCEKTTKLDFDPRDVKNYEKWAYFKCPFCHRPRITIEDGRIFQQ